MGSKQQGISDVVCLLMWRVCAMIPHPMIQLRGHMEALIGRP